MSSVMKSQVHTAVAGPARVGDPPQELVVPEVHKMSESESIKALQDDRFINSDHLLSSGGTMLKTICDKKGRIRLSQAVRSKYGEKFLVLEGRRELILRPIPRHPLQDLREIGRLLKGKSVEELKEAIEQQAMDEVGG